MKKSFFVLAVLISSLFAPLFAAEGEKSVISIDKAQKVENSKDPVSGDDCILLTGNVVISVTRGSTKTVISAERVNYNRATEMLYAEGSVALEQTGGSAGGEKITASSLLFNTATLEGVFDNGRAVQTSSDAINLPSGSTLIVASEVFGRDSGGTIAFKAGELTFCDDENPHWKIRATRIWLLPGGEFAFLNAILFVGRVPLLYLPAFYYPKDELIFNPAFGYRNREGYYINTTTYLYGRKPADAKSSADINSETSSSSSSTDDDDKINFFSFMNTSSVKEQRREGLVLHNLDEDYKGDTSKYFKVMADYYANLGTMVGFDGVFAPNSVITSLTTNFEMGFSNTVFRNNSVYLPKNSAGEIIQDKSNFLGQEAPFRYQANLKFTIAKPFSLTFSMPIYSDPYFNYDFNTRAETMDWIDYLMSGTNAGSTCDEVTVSEISSFTWGINGSYTFKIPETLNPYISSLSLSSFSSSIVFSSKANEELTSDERYAADSSWNTYTPERKFYYPSQITPLKVSGKISGTIFQYPSKTTTKKTTATVNINPPAELDTSEKKDEAASGNDKEDTKDTKDTKEVKSEKMEETEETLALEESYLPSLTTPSFSTTAINGLSYSLGYSVSPDFTSQFSYSSSALKTPEDFEWDDMQSTYIQTKAPTILTSKLGYRDSFISLTDTFTFNPVYQSHPYLKITDTTSEGGYTESSAKSVEKTDYAARKLDLTDVNALTLKPFYYTEHFSETSLTWNTTIKMIRTEFVGDADDPEWEYNTPDLTDEDCFTVHNLNFVLGASEFDKKVTQQLSLTTTLPPQVDSYKGTLTLGFPYVSLSAGTGIHEKSSTDDTWVKDDFVQSLTVNMFNSKLKFSQSYTYDLEDWEHESLKFSLSGFNLSAAFTASYTTGYTFVTEEITTTTTDEETGEEKTTATTISKGWSANSEKSFQPYQFSLSYSSGTKTFKYLSDRITFSPSLSTSAVYDFVRPTNTYFKFIPAITFKVNNFLDITFSMETKNSVVYRYFCSDDEYNEKYMGKGERNFLQDLIDSFRFDDEEKRKSSAFKLQTLKASVTHDLDDWDLNCSFSITPRLLTSSSTDFDSSRNNGKSYYDFSPYFSISVAWRPLASMKTQIVDEYGEWELNP
ncbi:MAG: LPS-assembly protein LptD [Treponema sp.]|nr:LPS-assembly protein LptD [Treponema sp.]